MKYWKIQKIEDVLDYVQPTQYIVKDTQYNDSYDIPVLTPGKSFLLGYTNEKEGVFDDIPTIIFDDFTTAFKYVDFPFKVKSSAMKMLKVKSKEYDIKFLYYLMLSLNFEAEEHKRHWISIYSQQLVPLPPLDQQKKIASILDAADAYRQKTKALISKYDELTQSLFLDMFGDPVKNEKGFLSKKLGEVCTVKGGKRVPKDEKLVSENTGFPYIKAGNIKSGKITLKDLEYLLPKTREKLKRYIVNKGDVCITVVGANIGDVGIVPENLHHANLTENANKILINNYNTLNNMYLANYLQMDFVQKNISAKTMAVGVPKLALFRIEQIELLLPPLTLQTQFAERVQAVEQQKAKAQESLEKAEELFNSLLQRAFNGELVEP
jgi:type I restriction enzyme S subunit